MHTVVLALAHAVGEANSVVCSECSAMWTGLGSVNVAMIRLHTTSCLAGAASATGASRTRSSPVIMNSRHQAVFGLCTAVHFNLRMAHLDRVLKAALTSNARQWAISLRQTHTEGDVRSPCTGLCM